MQQHLDSRLHKMIVMAFIWTCLSSDNTTLNPTHKRTDQTLSDFQTGIGAAAHTTLGIEQLISHARSALLDVIAFLHGSYGAVIVTSCP